VNDIKSVVSTEHIVPSARLEFWQRQVGSLLTRLECTSTVGGEFFGSVTIHPSAPVNLFEIDTAAHRIARAKQKIAQIGEEQVFVCMQIEGRAIVEQDSRQGILRPGDMTLLDTSKPFLADFPFEMAQLVFQVPRMLVRKQVGVLERFTAMVLPAENALARITVDFVRSLARDFDRLSPEIAQTLSAQALDMISMAFMSLPEEGHSTRSSVTRSMLAYRGRAFIEANLRNPALSPSDVAEHLGISKRYLSTVFASNGLSFERFLRERRLQKCARDLTDLGQAVRPIGDIAHAWGFNNLTHFSQSFKAAFGKTPRDYRRQALPGV
jgi:AraC-like DNA-binding protein